MHWCPQKIECLQDSVLDIYLLPQTPWSQAMALQQRLVYELGAAPRRRAALILCEHSPIITVGRQGSRQHIRFDEDELRSLRLDVQWTNRGGGCWLHWPGQLAAYCIVPLTPPEFGLDAYRSGLYQTLLNVLDEFKISAARDTAATGVRVGNREIASVGIAVKDWVAYFGCRLNVCVPLEKFAGVQSTPRSPRKMTCMFRELRAPVRFDGVRESFMRHFAEVFGFGDYYLLDSPPMKESLRRLANVSERGN